MPDVLTTGSVVAGYRIARLIGRGATGGEYLAEDPEGQQVALKVLIPELAQNERFRERFLREARIAASLEEPHIVPTFASSDEAGMLYLVMRFVDGLDLREVLKRGGPLGTERAVDLVGHLTSVDSLTGRRANLPVRRERALGYQFRSRPRDAGVRPPISTSKAGVPRTRPGR